MRRRLQHNKTYWTTLASKVKDQYHMLKPKRKDWRTEELFELTAKNEETGQQFNTKYRIYMKMCNIHDILLFYFLGPLKSVENNVRLYLKQIRTKCTYVYKNTLDAKKNWEFTKILDETIESDLWFRYKTDKPNLTWCVQW